jgi:hypothetical protein
MMQAENSAIAHLMTPDTLTPGQYYDGLRADDAYARPVKRLMLAVLEDAMRCYQTYARSRNRAQRRLFVEAEAWLMDRGADGAFAFETVCEALGIEPSCLRDGLRRWRAQQMDGLNPRRLARRSPVTRVGHISAPLRRRQRRRPEAAGNDDSGVAAAVNGNRISPANRTATFAHGVLGHERCDEIGTEIASAAEIASIDRASGAASAEARPPARIALQQDAPALM